MTPIEVNRLDETAVSHAYDMIGVTYNVTRRADPRIEAVIWSALNSSRSVLNVGAGTGAYEPPDRAVAVVEPSPTMRKARLPVAAPCIAGSAESPPCGDDSFDAAMAILTLHHWSDYRAGLAELRRVARRVIIVHWDQTVLDRLWLALLSRGVRLRSPTGSLARRRDHRLGHPH